MAGALGSWMRHRGIAVESWPVLAVLACIVIGAFIWERRVSPLFAEIVPVRDGEIVGLPLHAAFDPETKLGSKDRP